MRVMTVVQPGGPESLVLDHAPTPRPGPGELTIDVAYAGVGYVDTLFRNGTFPLPPPFTPGIEVSGHVREVGGGVTDVQVGDRVAALLNDFGRGSLAGGYAEVALARADLVFPLPSQLRLPAAAGAVVNGTTAWLALEELAAVRKDDILLVLGATGGVGEAVIRLAASMGVRNIIAAVRDVSSRPQVLAAGATQVVPRADLQPAVSSLAPDGVDVVVDPVGGAARAAALDLLAPRGRLALVGTASGQDVSLSTDSIWHRSITVSGVSVGGIAHLATQQIAEAAEAALLVLAARDGLRPAVVLLEDVASVHAALESGNGPAKTVLAVRTNTSD